MLHQTRIGFHISMAQATSTTEEPGGQFVAHPTWYRNTLCGGGQRLT